MSKREELLTLTNRVAANKATNNALDVVVELALFRPSSQHTAVRANAAGTKVIYTYACGDQISCWSDDWTIPARRDVTVAILRPRALKARS